MTRIANDPELDGRSLITRLKIRASRHLPRPLLTAWNDIKRAVNFVLPKRLFARSLLIIVLPVLILQLVITVVFLDRHWELTTRRLATATARDIGAIVDLYRAPGDPAARDARLQSVARRLDLKIAVLPGNQLEDDQLSSFDLLRTALTEEINHQLGAPVSIAGINDWAVDVRVYIDDETFDFEVQRDNAYASNWHIFLVWMASTSIVLIIIAVLFLRNQIRPIERLADSMERFGKGQPVANFRASGAREVRRATISFFEMRRRIERQVEQRTAMLAGVSHDLRTILTRFRLELALFGNDPDAEAMHRDVGEMEAMLEAYIAFARDDFDEASEVVDVERIIGEAARSAGRSGVEIAWTFTGEPLVPVRPGGFRRAIDNLLGNAVRYGRRAVITAAHDGTCLTVTVDDDGPGIPEESREDVFRPFFRLDSARNQDHSGSGLGLAIVRDIARAHGGNVRLASSPLGGCRATLRIPV